MLSVNPRRSKTDRYEEFDPSPRGERALGESGHTGHAGSRMHAVRASGTSTGRQLRVKND